MQTRERVRGAAAYVRFDADGLVTEVVDVWPDPYEPPPGRGHLVERW